MGWLARLPRATTTRRKLRWLRNGLVAAAATAMIGCLWVFVGVLNTADDVYAQTTPAVIDTYKAQVALLSAHGAAIESFAGDDAILGAGEEHRTQMAVAGQSLTRVAANNAAGDAGSQEIQVVEALLVSYTGQIEEADVYFRQGGATGGSTLVSAHLRDASSVLAEILARIDRLRAEQIEELDEQAGTGWTRWAAHLAWVLPTLVLATLLVATQVYLSRRFRRTLNPPLVVATALAVLLGAFTSLSLWSTDKLGDTRDSVTEVGSRWQARMGQLGNRNAESLDGLLSEQCGSSRPCLDTVDRIVETVSGARSGAAAGPEAPADDIVRQADQTVDTAAQAANSKGLEFGLPIVSLGIAALVLFGLQPRIEEYRYQQR